MDGAAPMRQTVRPTSRVGLGAAPVRTAWHTGVPHLVAQGQSGVEPGIRITPRFGLLLCLEVTSIGKNRQLWRGV